MLKIVCIKKLQPKNIFFFIKFYLYYSSLKITKHHRKTNKQANKNTIGMHEKEKSPKRYNKYSLFLGQSMARVKERPDNSWLDNANHSLEIRFFRSLKCTVKLFTESKKKRKNSIEEKKKTL